jgi:hypothetical protein
MNDYLDNLIDKTAKKDSLQIQEALAKRILFNYIYKISQFRYNNKAISKVVNEGRYQNSETDISYPHIPKTSV